MKKPAYDIFTLGHLLGGVFSSIVIFPNNPIISFILSNLIHLLSELNEVYIDPITKKELGNFKNHIGDIIAFFIGWILGYCLIQKYKIPKKYVIILSIILFIGFLYEFVREIYIRNGNRNKYVKFIFNIQ